METTIITLKKQKQLLKIEIMEYETARKEGRDPFHPKSYYIKLAYAYKHILQLIKLLESAKDDIYNNFDYTEQ